MENLFSIPMIILYALFYGITMKVADLLDEHGLEWFKGEGDNIISGFLWGFFGFLLVLSNNIVANIVLAMNIAFIARNRLDYLNHQIAATIIIIGFLFSSVFSPILFINFYAIFLIFGSLKDYVKDILRTKQVAWIFLTETMLYYPVPTFIYSFIYGNWIVFWVFLVYTIAYNATKFVYKRIGYA